ncbi:MAG: DUF4136 domain-containing protein [Phycisphaerales bacterium]
MNDLERAMQGTESVSMHPVARLARPNASESDIELRNETDAAILRVFRDRGYRTLNPGKSDLLIAYAIGTSNQLSDRDLLKIFGITAGMGADPDHPRGGFVIVLVDRRRNQVVWRTAGSAEQNDDLDANRYENIKTAVEKLLHELPQRSE